MRHLCAQWEGMAMLELKIPGKLYLIGEYNVLKDGHSAILFTLDKYVKVIIEPSANFVLVNEKKVYPLVVSKGLIKVEDDSLIISQSAMQIALNYLDFLNVKLIPFRISLTNELVDNDGLKYGLGSSAAILIAILKSILLFHKVKISNLELFKISVLGQHLIGNKTSGGDLAACVFGGLVFYTRYDYEWLMRHLSDGFHLIAEDWPLLDIENLPYQKLQIQVGWTLSPHATDHVQIKKIGNELAFIEFANKANIIVLKAKEALYDSNFDLLGSMMSRYQALLYKLDFDLELGFNSEKLNTLIKIANELRGYSKISGAGYGDCGISLCANSEKLIKAWKEAGIMPLKYRIANPLEEI